MIISDNKFKLGKNILILSLGCFIFKAMIYGLILLKHAKTSTQKQRAGILGVATEKHFHIDKFISFEDKPDLSLFKPKDTIICYAWNCLCKKRTFLRLFIKYVLENNIYICSATSKYCIDKQADIKTFERAFELYEDIRFNFLSNKSLEGVVVRVQNGHEPGRKTGSRNVRHILDGKEKAILKMYADGCSMYAIAKKIKVSAPTIKKFLVSQS